MNMQPEQQESEAVEPDGPWELWQANAERFFFKRLIPGAAVCFALVILIWFMIDVTISLQRGGHLRFRTGYGRIEPGMSLDDAEALIGAAGKEIAEAFVPQTASGQVVNGDRYFQWESNYCRIISFKDGKVAEKNLWEPSL